MKDALIKHFAGVSSEARSSSYSCQVFFVFDNYFYVMFRRTLRVLVPGAGLGRLAYDVAKLGMYISAHTPLTRGILT